MASNFNWSWINILKETLNFSQSVNNSGGVILPLLAADRGIVSSADLRNSINSISSNTNQQWRLWQNNIRPILDSLPAGTRDTRWRSGKGLPPKIDALNYGVQGTTLFVFNDADEIKASGRYWKIEDERPITIAEALEDIWSALNDIEITDSTSEVDADLEPLWRAVGHRYQNSALTSISTSLDARTRILESNINQLTRDLYGNNEGYSWTFGSPLSFSVAQNIDYLLQIHNVTGWQADPSDVSHDGLGGEVGAHNHAYTDILPMPDVALTQARVSPNSTLYNDILRLRYELQVVKGSTNWYSDSIDPVTTEAGSLSLHMSYVGNGTTAENNPHGLNYEDVGIDDLLDNIANFIGMTDYTTNESPNYTSTNYVTQSSNLEVAISTLDESISNAISGFVTSAYYGPFDRTGLSESQREETAITLVHNKGQNPASVNVIDLSPEAESEEGMYSSPLIDIISDFPDSNTVRIWTSARIVSVSLIFHGAASTSLTQIGGVTLNGAYNYGGAGLGRSIVVTSGSVTISATTDANSNVLELNQNDSNYKKDVLVVGSNTNSTNAYSDGYAIKLSGNNTSGQTIWSNNLFNIGSLYDSEFRNFISLGSSLSITAENLSTGDSDILISSLGGGTGVGYLTLGADVLSIGNSTTGVINLTDAYLAASSWVGTELPFASNSTEYSSFRTNFGEVSLLSSINTLSNQATGSFDFINVNTSSYQFSGSRNSILGIAYSATGTTSVDLRTVASTEGRMVIIKDTGNNAAANTITITTEGSETIDSAATKTITASRGSLILVYDGISDWMIV